MSSFEVKGTLRFQLILFGTEKKRGEVERRRVEILGVGGDLSLFPFNMSQNDLNKM